MFLDLDGQHQQCWDQNTCKGHSINASGWEEVQRELREVREVLKHHHVCGLFDRVHLFTDQV